MIDFVIGGAAKSGTSLLAQALSAHPGCNFSKIKEPAYFCTQVGWVDGGDPRGPTFSGNYRLGPEWYDALFRTENTGGIYGEASTVYFEAEESAELLLAQNPRLKWIVCLREPVSRAYSHYWEERKHGLPVGDFSLNGARSCPRVERVLNVSRYELQLKRTLRFLPKEQLLIIIAEELFKDPDKAYLAVCDFLDLPYSKEMGEITGAVNPGRQPRNKWLARTLLRSSKSIGYRYGTTPIGSVLRAAKKAASVFAYSDIKYPPLATEVNQELWCEYEPTRQWLQDFMQADRPLWSSA